MTHDVVPLMPAVARIAHFLHLEETSVYDRDDMVASAYLGLIEADRRYDPERGASFATFARQVARWRVLDDYRAQFPFAKDRFKDDEWVGLVDLATLEDPRWEHYLGVEDSTEYVADLFATLTPRERLVVVARYWRDWTGTEIARRLGVDQTGVNRSLRVALDKLRRAVGAG